MKHLLAFLRPRGSSPGRELRIGTGDLTAAARRSRTMLDTGTRRTEALGKTGIVLLPFTDLTPDPDHPYLADGFTRDLAQMLSLNPSFFADVIEVPHSEWSVEGAAIRIEPNLMIEGALARVDWRLNVDVQVVECSSGDILWSDRFSTPLDQVAMLQDDIAEAIAGAVISTPYFLQSSERPAGTACAAAWALRQAARGLLHEGPDCIGLAGAVRLFALASRLDPLYADAKIGLAETLGLQLLLLSSPDVPGDRARRDRVHDAAEVLSPSHAELPFVRGLNELDAGRPERAILALERSVRVNAIMIPARIFLSLAEARSGRVRAARSDAAIAFKRAGRPGWTALADYARAEAALARGAAQDAETAISEAVAASGGPSAALPPVLLLHSLLLAGRGRQDAARALLADHWPKDLPPPDAATVEPWLDALPGQISHRKAWLEDVIGRLSRGN